MLLVHGSGTGGPGYRSATGASRERQGNQNPHISPNSLYRTRDGRWLALPASTEQILVDINPLGITGGLILGAAEPAVRPRLFRRLLIYGIVSIVVAPLLAWAAFGWW
jgi:hypothetical protein